MIAKTNLMKIHTLFSVCRQVQDDAQPQKSYENEPFLKC